MLQPIFSHFFPLFDTIFARSGIVNTEVQIILVVQGLRDYFVAEFGQIVALNWNYKSVT
jgi:hypothetical protein